jgi:hypothetical protein
VNELKTWVVYRHSNHGEDMVYDMREMSGTSMMIGQAEYRVLGIKQIVPITTAGTTTGFLIVLDVEAK